MAVQEMLPDATPRFHGVRHYRGGVDEHERPQLDMPLAYNPQFQQAYALRQELTVILIQLVLKLIGCGACVTGDNAWNAVN